MTLQTNIREAGLQGILEKRLTAIQNEARKEIIPFSLVMHRLCSGFSITKKECWDLLFYLQDKGMVKVVAFHGVRIERVLNGNLPLN